MIELIIGLATIVATSLVLGYGKDDYYDTTKPGTCTEEDYELAEKIKNL